MKKTRRILGIIAVILLILAAAGIIWYKAFFAKVYSQSDVTQNMEIGSNVSDLTMEGIVKDMADFPDRFAGTKSNAEAGQYIRNYFREAGLSPYFENEDSYYHSFYGKWLKNSNYYNVSVNGTVENVVGKIRGADSTKAVVISAHFDSYMSKGILDNASGVSVLLELAKRLGERLGPGTYPVDIVFVSFNAEESGLEGSKAFYKDISARYDEFYNINMDAVGAVDKPLAFRNLDSNSEALYQDFQPMLDRYDIPYEDSIYAANIYGEPWGNSDHVSFQEEGRAAIIIGEAKLQGYTNTELDKDIGILDFAELTRLADAIEDFIISANGKIY